MNAAKEQVIQRQICQLAHIEKETTKEYRERSGGWLKMKRGNSCRKKMEDGGEDMELKYELWKESIFQEKVICECRKRLSGYRRAVFCFICVRKPQAPLPGLARCVQAGRLLSRVTVGLREGPRRLSRYT